MSTSAYGGGGGGGGAGYGPAGAGGAGYSPFGAGIGGTPGTSSSRSGGAGANSDISSGSVLGGGGGGAGYMGGSGPAAAYGQTYGGGSGGNGGSGAPRTVISVGTAAGGGGGGGAGGAAFYSKTTATTKFANNAIGGRGGNGGTGGYGRGSGGDGGTGLQDGAAGAAITLAAGYLARGGVGGSGAGGSFGGAGIRFTDTSKTASLVNNGDVTGGKGGYDFGGVGGSGGAGVTLAATGSRLLNTGSIQGGSGGGGTGGTGVGGSGVTGTGLRIGDTGSITGGMGATQADAITFLGGANTLALGANAAINGAVDIRNNGTLTFDQSALDGAPANASLAAPIIGQGAVIKVGRGTLTLSGDNTYTGGTTISGGTLSVSADGNLGVGGPLTIGNGATLETTASFATTRQIALNGTATIQVDGGTFALGGPISGSMLTKSGVGTLEFVGPLSVGTTISAGTLALDSAGGGAVTFGKLSGTATATLALGQSAQNPGGQFASQLVGFNAGSVLDLKGYTVTSTSYANGTLSLQGTFAGSSEVVTETYDFANASAAPLMTSSDGSGGTYVMVCFASGTRIRTVSGGQNAEVAVEHLRVGDLAVTASGEHRPIRWIGHRTIDCAAAPPPHDVRPVRIRAGAFGLDADGEAVPARELQLSPGHPVLVGSGSNEVLVPIMCLINGTSIARKPVDSVTYWHVELEGGHDILLAEGLPAESYLDWGDRPFFGAGAAAHALANPDHVPPGLGARCRPVALDGPLVEAERRRLDAVFYAEMMAMCHWPTAAADPSLGF